MRCAVILILAVFAAVADACTWTDCTAECGGGMRTCSREGKKDKDINCHMQTCNEGDISECGPADVVFILDSSGSLGEMNWWRTKQMAIDVTRGMNIGVDDTRVGLVVFSGKAKITFDLNKHLTRETLEAAIWESEWMGGKTNTRDALIKAEEVFDTTGRKGVKNIALVVTDGRSNKGAEFTVPQAEGMHAKGIEIFAFGIGGNLDEDEVNGIASNPDDVHAKFVSSYTALAADLAAIISDICDATKLIECDEWEEAWSTECVYLTEDQTCGEGTQTKTRECRSRFWAEGPETILTDSKDVPCIVEPCPPPPCTWTECDKPCGGGKKICDNGDGKVKKIKCNMQSCTPVEGCDPVDLVFLLDSSGSIGPKNWARTKQFAIDVANGLPVSQDGTHVSAISFSGSTTVGWTLNDYPISTDKFAIEALLWDMDYKKKRTGTAKGLQDSLEVLLSSKRPDVKKILITVTDGLSNVNKDQTIPSAEAIHAEGILSFAIILGEFEETAEFEAIASQPHDIFLNYLKNYNALPDIIEYIIHETCAAPPEDEDEVTLLPTT